MTDRRKSAPSPLMQAGSPAHKALMQKVEQQHAETTGALEAFFERTSQRLDRIERDVASVERKQSDLKDTVGRELDEMRRDLGETREAIALGDGRRTKAAAEGGAAGATAVVEKVVEKVAVAVPAPWYKRIEVQLAGFVAFVAAVKNIGPFVHEVNKFWAYMGTIGKEG